MKSLEGVLAVEAEKPAGRSPTLVILVGPPGTGKSYLVRRLVERLSLEVVETDAIRRQLTPNPTFTPAENASVFSAAHRRLARLLRDGQKDVVLDATNLHRGGRRRLYRIAEGAGARTLAVRTIAPDAVVAERLRGRRAGLDPHDRSEAGWEVYVRMKSTFQEITRPHLLVDTSSDLEPAIEQIVSFIRGEPSSEL